MPNPQTMPHHHCRMACSRRRREMVAIGPAGRECDKAVMDRASSVAISAVARWVIRE